MSLLSRTVKGAAARSLLLGLGICLPAACAAEDVFALLAEPETGAVVQVAGQAPLGVVVTDPALVRPDRGGGALYSEPVEQLPPPPADGERASREPSEKSTLSNRSAPRSTTTTTELLSRGLFTVTIDSAPSARVAAQSEKLKEENRIRDLAATRYAFAPHFVSPSISKSGGPCWTFAWASPALYHRPLLFEQPNVERYGHQWILCRGDKDTQSLVSGAHFFGSVLALPYLLGAHDCCEPEYVLGAYRPGSCNPHQVVKCRKSRRGLLMQAGAITGVALMAP